MKCKRKPFPLRLPISIHEKADDLANREGISLNQFITLALAEKLTRSEDLKMTRNLEPGILRVNGREAGL